MKNLKTLTDQELHESFRKTAQTERETTIQVIEHIREIFRRRLYAKYAHPSMWSYLTKELGYESGAAQRRLQAAKLSDLFPQAGESLKNGELSISSASELQSFFDRERRTKKKMYSFREKQTILKQAQNRSTR